MITLDRIKIVVPSKYFSITNYGLFESKMKNGILTTMSYTQKSPFLLYVKVDYEHHEAVIEFTGKILMDSYPELINRDNIAKCFVSCAEHRRQPDHRKECPDEGVQETADGI